MFMLSEMLEDFISRNLELTTGEITDLGEYQARIRLAGQEKSFYAEIWTKEYFTLDENPYKKLLGKAVAESRFKYEEILSSFIQFMQDCIKNHTAK